MKMQEKDCSHSLGMTMSVISNEVRDLSSLLFSKELTKVTKVLEDKILKLRVLRVLRGENYLLLIAALPRWVLRELRGE